MNGDCQERVSSNSHRNSAASLRWLPLTLTGTERHESRMKKKHANCLVEKLYSTIFFLDGLMVFSSPLCYCTEELLSLARASVSRPSVRPSVKPIFSETMKRINTKFCGKVPIHHLPRPFFFKSLLFLFLTMFFIVFFNRGPYGSKVSSGICSESTHQIHYKKKKYAYMYSMLFKF